MSKFFSSMAMKCNEFFGYSSPCWSCKVCKKEWTDKGWNCYCIPVQDVDERRLKTACEGWDHYMMTLRKCVEAGWVREPSHQEYIWSTSLITRRFMEYSLKTPSIKNDNIDTYSSETVVLSSRLLQKEISS